MGNANVVEGGGENAVRERGEGGDSSVGRSPGGFPTDRSLQTGPIARPSSFDSFANSPPRSPTRSRSPIPFSPPEPVRPLSRSSERNAKPDHPWTDDLFYSTDDAQEPGIPVLITWSYGGNDVAVEGSWDNWMSRKMLSKSGKDHVVLLVLPCGVYRYKFIVDNEKRCMPDLPCISDENGHFDHILDVQDYVPDCIEGVAEFETPPSPDSSYNQPFPITEDFAKEPPVIPPHAHRTGLGEHDMLESPVRPHHVVLNHLFIQRSGGSQSLVGGLGVSHRFQEKFVTVVMYKPLRR